MPLSIDDVADKIILKMSVGDSEINHWKLHGLLYYIQAWHLTNHSKPLFEGRFEAWMHGPIHRPLFNRLKGKGRNLYSVLTASDVRPEYRWGVSSEFLHAEEFVDEILKVYGLFSGAQLKELAQREDPYKKAREGVPLMEPRCTRLLDETVMMDFYRSRIDGV